MKSARDDEDGGRLRRHNNRVKAVLIDEQVPKNARVLDLACGHGQDMGKYAKKDLQIWVGIDSAEGAVEEGQRRAKDMKMKGQRGAKEGMIVQSLGWVQEEAVWDKNMWHFF